MDEKRQQMVSELRTKYGFTSRKILSVMLRIPRHRFVDGEYLNLAYSDNPVPLGYGATMSQPYTVAFMTKLALGGPRFKGKNRRKVLEIGTGSGYQAAILSRFFKEVYTIEIVPELAKKASVNLKKLGFDNVLVKIGSGEKGWGEHAPYDAIVVTAGVTGGVPQALFDQLNEEGILVAPVGNREDKEMVRYTKNKDMIKKEHFGVFRFVPFVTNKN